MRQQIAYDTSELWDMLRRSASKSEAIFGTIACVWGFHILTFDHTRDVIAKAMLQAFPYLPLWGLALLFIGILQFYGAFFQRYALRRRATFANFIFMLFISWSLVITRTLTPGVLLCPAYAFWLFENYQLLGVVGDART